MPGWQYSYTGSKGDAYVTTFDGFLWIWNGTQWNSIVKITGPQGFRGYTGSQGVDGAAVDRGYTGSASFDGSVQVIITNTSSSTSTTTGALIVTGGVGIGENLNVNGNITISGNILPSTPNALDLGSSSFPFKTLYLSTNTLVMGTARLGATANGAITTPSAIITGTTITTGTSSGALQVVGGVGVGGSIWAGSSMIANNHYGNINTLFVTTYPVASNANLLIDPDGTGKALFSTSTQVLVFNTDTSTSTTTGAIVVSGGVGVVKDLYVGGTIYQKGIAVSTGTGSGTGLASGNITMFQSGYLTVTQGTQRWYAPYNLNITSIKTKLGTAGSNANVITINRNATPIITITIDGAATSGTTYTTPLSMNEDDYLTVDVTPVLPQITTATNLYVQFKYQAV